MNNTIKNKRHNVLSKISLSLLLSTLQMGSMNAAFAAPKEPDVNISHVSTYFNALVNKNKKGIPEHFAPNIVLNGPIFAEPAAGRDTVAQILAGFLDTIDTLEVNKTFASGPDVAVFFSFSVNGITVKGNEHLHVNENGLIDSIEVAWRPLPASVKVQEIMAKKLGFPPMHLIQETAVPVSH